MRDPLPSLFGYVAIADHLRSTRCGRCETRVYVPLSVRRDTGLVVVTTNVVDTRSTNEVSPLEQCGAVYTPTELPGGLKCTLTPGSRRLAD